MTGRLTSAKAVIKAGLAPASELAALEEAGRRHVIGITKDMVRLIDRAASDDPIARQFVPSGEELVSRAHEFTDPIGDKAHEKAPGVIHRYPDRVLLKVVSACPVYCRFCFRREMLGPKGEALAGAKLDQALDYIAAQREVREVILTGGDPFMLSARRVAALTQRLLEIRQIEILRWHTRVPVVEPARVTKAFASALRSKGPAIYVAIHANHPREFTPDAQNALARLTDAGLVLVSQSVLLKGVNDTVDTLEALMRAFLRNRIKPYYLHHADLAPGTSHFRTTIEDGQRLMAALHARASGLAMPHYVIDIPGGVSKAPLTPPYIAQTETGMRLKGDDGVWRDYKD